MASLEQSVAVDCMECDLGEDADDYKALVNFADKHHEHTGHEIRWVIDTSPPDVDVTDHQEIELDCQTCNDTWSFNSRGAAEEFADEHAKYTDHGADGVTEKTVWTSQCLRCGKSETFVDRKSAEDWRESHQNRSDQNTGVAASLSERDKFKNIKQVIDELVDEYDDGAPVPFVALVSEEQGWSQSDVLDDIDKLKQKGEIYEPATGYLRNT